MFYSGLLSVSFRQKTAEEVAKAAVESGLSYIEWGSDVHVPINDPSRLEQIVAIQKKYGLTCCSYGTYFYLGETPLEQLPAYIHVAKTLGTNVLRLWTGKKGPQHYTQKEKREFFRICRQAAKLAEEAGVILCMECHNNTYTETKEGARELMDQVDSPAFRMYWQPNPLSPADQNLEYLRAIKDKIVHIHVFHRQDQKPVPLAWGTEDWLSYMKEFDDDRYFLLEFMPDNEPDRLSIEAKTLRELIAHC